jgi:hypothetical protein
MFRLLSSHFQALQELDPRQNEQGREGPEDDSIEVETCCPKNSNIGSFYLGSNS